MLHLLHLMQIEQILFNKQRRYIIVYGLINYVNRIGKQLKVNNSRVFTFKINWKEKR